jgi:predicted extracellular nuclease
MIAGRTEALPMTDFPTVARALRLTSLLAGALAAAALALPASAQVVISQVYGGGGNSGATLRNDFIELINRGTAPVAVGGWSVQYASASGTSWQVTPIPAGITLAPGQYLLIQQAPGAGGTVDLVADVIPTTPILMSATNGKVALSNASAALSGAAPSGAAVVDIVSYGSATATEGTPVPALTNTTAAIRREAGCQDTNNNAADFLTGTPTPRNRNSPVATCADGGAPPLAATIMQIQGSGAVSPLAGQNVVTSGVVTRVNGNGFFIQDLTGDGNPATSDGLFVFTGLATFAAVAPGNLVQVTGPVTEFAPGGGTLATPLTQIGNPTTVSLLGTGYTLQPADVALPVAPGDSLERLEGMLVRITSVMTVQSNELQARFGLLMLGVDRHETPTNRFRPNTPQALALADLQSRSRMLLDDGSSVQNPNPTPYFFGTGVPRVGDAVSGLVGVLDFGLSTSSSAGPGLYRLHPTAAPVFAIANPRPTGLAGLYPGTVKVGAMNVLNFFTTFTNGQTAFGQTGQGCSLGSSVTAGNCRGADSLDEYLRQRDKILAALAGLDADVVGLVEIQNNGNVAAQALVDALNARTRAGPWAVVSVPAQGTGTDAIRVAIIYRPARVTPVGAAVSDPSPVHNRPPLAQTFSTPSGQRFSVIVNHKRSKGSCPASGPDADQGDGQGCWNATRVAQAQALRAFAATVQASAGSDDVLLLGDLNAYGQEDPIVEFTGNGWVDEPARFSPFAYSYVFDGLAGRLDHALASASLSPKVVTAGFWAINADESVAYDYNLEFKQPACPACAPDPANRRDPYRSSDHDPVLVVLNLAPAPRAAAAAPAAPARAGR